MKKEDLLLTIIVPYYDTYTYTKKLFDVLTPQLTDDVEVILVDDGCNEKRLDKFKANVIHLEENSGGASKPRNVALDIAKGRYIAFIDSDDTISTDYVSEILKKIKSEYFDYCLIGWKSASHEVIGDLPDWNCAVWTTIWKKDLIGLHRFDESLRIGEDYDFCQNTRMGEKTYIRKVLYHYNIDRKNSLTRSENKTFREVKNAFYFTKLSACGGVETFLYYMAKLYRDKDICVYYEDADKNQLLRLKKHIRCVKWNGEEIYCEKMFYNYAPSGIIEHVHAKEHIQVLHTNYKRVGITPCMHPKITKYLGVSKWICDEVSKDFNIDVELCYNPVAIDAVVHNEDEPEPLHLISATRLFYDKGRERMIKLADILEKAKIPYVWHIFTDSRDAIDNPNMIFSSPRQDIVNFIKKADYLVQLSDNVEGFGYSVCEALCLGVPVLVTKCDAFLEIGVKNGKNGYVFDFDMSNVDAKKIYEKRPTFKYEPPKDNWGEVLADGESTYLKAFDEKVEVEAIIDPKFFDIELKEWKKLGEKYIVNRNRADDLIEKGLVKFVRDVEEKKVKKRASRRVSKNNND